MSYSKGDADVDIVKAAIKESMNCNVTLIGEDTDLLVLLLYFAENSQYKFYFRRDKQKSYWETKVHDIFYYIRSEICKALFIHAFTGCDTTTSSFFGIGKGSCFAKSLKNEVLRWIAQSFTASGKSHKEVEEEGIAAMKILLLQRWGEHLLNLRSYLPHRKCHCYRVYLQVY